MRKAMHSFISIVMLLGSSCAPRSPDNIQKVEILAAMLKYLGANPESSARPPCFDRRMLRDTTKFSIAGIVQTDSIYGYIDDDFWKNMRACRAEKSIPRYQFFEPKIGWTGASMRVHYICGALCGDGVTYKLRRGDDRDGWQVVSKHRDWVS